MAATALPVVTIDRTGTILDAAGSFVDNVNGNSFPSGPYTWVELLGATATDTLTFAIPGSVDGQTITGKPIPVGTTADIKMGPFPPSIYGAVVTFTSSNANAKVAVYNLVPQN